LGSAQAVGGKEETTTADASAEVGSLRKSDEAGESRQSKGRDGLRRKEHHQLGFAFADNPQGGGNEGGSGVPEQRSWLLHTAKHKTVTSSFTRAVDTDRLLEAVASEANLAGALLSVVRNKGAPGIDGQTVEEAEAKAPRLLAELRRDLLAERFFPGDIRRVWIDKPGGGQRGLGIPNVRTRVVQQAVLQILEPIFEPTFHPSSHGFRRKRGAHTAIAEATVYLEEGFRTVVDLDLAQFFDRVHHQRLLDRMSQRVADPRILTLIRRMLKSAVVMPDGTRVEVVEGTPQGGPLSPFLSNIVLDEFDKEMARRGLRFVRYADDANVFVRSERAGNRVMASLRRFLEKRLRLQVNEEKSAVRSPEQVHFLGFCFRCTKGVASIEVALSSKTKRRLLTTIREMTPPNWGRSIMTCMADLSRYLNGWSAYYRLCTAEAAPELGVIDAHIRRRIRAIIVRQKKRPRFLFRYLLSRGVSRKCLLREGVLGEIQSARNCKGLPACVVPRTADLAQNSMDRVKPPTGQ
jgi:RNA-directed DNA polymerase